MRKKMMGGGMTNRMMYKDGTSKPISRSKNPGLLALSKTAKGKKVVKKSDRAFEKNHVGFRTKILRSIF